MKPTLKNKKLPEKKREDFPELTERQFRFCQAYVQKGSNATIAAKEAGYGTPDRRGSELCKLPKVKQTIDLLRKEVMENKNFTLSREINAEYLANLINDPTTPHASTLRAIEILNMMMGWNEPDKLELKPVIMDSDEVIIKKAERLLLENGYKLIAPPKGQVFTMNSLEDAIKMRIIQS
jgi:phage terminase small subunit